MESVAQAVSNLAIQFGDSDDDAGVMSRPFGVAILFAGVDEGGCQLYHMDPSGTYLQVSTSLPLNITSSFLATS